MVEYIAIYKNITSPLSNLLLEKLLFAKDLLFVFANQNILQTKISDRTCMLFQPVTLGREILALFVIKACFFFAKFLYDLKKLLYGKT